VQSHKENLKSILDNDSWMAVPELKDFSIRSIPEWKSFLRHPQQAAVIRKAEVFFGERKSVNPFLNKKLDESSDNIRQTENGDDSGDEEPDELKQEFVDEDARKANEAVSKKKLDGPLISSSAINMLRYIGRYLQMIRVLQDISFEICVGLKQIWEYYVYSMHQFFNAFPQGNAVEFCSGTLRRSLTKFYEEIEGDSQSNPNANANPNAARDRDAQAKPATLNLQSNTMNLLQSGFGLNYRVLACEGLMFLHSAMLEARPHLERLLPPARRDFLKEFYAKSVDIAPELRIVIYKHVTFKFVNFDAIVNAIAKRGWDMKEIDMQYSPYVEQILKEFRLFSARLSTLMSSGEVPQSVADCLHELAIEKLMASIVEGFSRTKKCSNEGRAIMALDLKVLQGELERITNLRPLPKVAYVDEYIKAFYLSEEMAIPWIKQHQTSYTKEQIMQVITIGVAANMKNKKQRTEVLALIEEIGKPKPPKA
jgi:hypothetical protein